MSMKFARKFEDGDSALKFMQRLSPKSNWSSTIIDDKLTTVVVYDKADGWDKTNGRWKTPPFPCPSPEEVPPYGMWF